MNEIHYSKMLSFEKILIYGAGSLGESLIKKLYLIGIDKSKITVWDEEYKQIVSFVVSILKPNFKQIADYKNTIVIIALCLKKNESTANDIKRKFIAAGYKHVFWFSDITFTSNSYDSKQFKNIAYRDCEYQEDIDFSELKPLVKPIAYYLPQFHEIPENNDWWGRGFTEWVNTAKAKKMFRGHYQPREPHDDIGYYDLSDVEAIRKQAKMARRHGIYGWCMYYYWFSGRKLLTKPIDILLENKDIEMHFCLMWCNASWSKIWVGDHNKDLISFKYNEDDPEKFIRDIKKYTDDKRYIRVNGNALIIIYQLQNSSPLQDIIARWRKHAQKIGIGEIAVFAVVHSCIKRLKWDICLDGTVNFSLPPYAVNAVSLTDENTSIQSDKLYYYDECVDNYLRIIEQSDHNTYLCSMCGWDNSPRYSQSYKIYDLGFTLRKFYNLTRYVTDEALNYQKEFIFLFAWNEWAEGAYIEPDKRFGYAMLNTFSKAIYGLPYEYNEVEI